MQDTIGEVRSQTSKVTFSWYDIFCVPTLITRKIQVVYGRSTYRITAPLCMYTVCLFSALEMNEKFEWRVMASNTRRSRFLISHLRSAHRTTAMLSRTLFVWFRVTWEIRLESYGPAWTRIGLSLIQHCVRILQARTYLYGAQLRMTTELTYLMYGCYTHQTTTLLPVMDRFIGTNFS